MIQTNERVYRSLMSPIFFASFRVKVFGKTTGKNRRCEEKKGGKVQDSQKTDP